MALLFGCHDASQDAESVARWLASVEETALFRRPLAAAAADGSACAALGGAACQGANGLLAALAGSPRWNHPELAGIAQTEGQAQALIAAYRRFGTGLCRELRGAFSLALIDLAQDTVLLALDRIGIRHLFYARTEAGLVFGGSADALLAHPGVSGEIDPQSVFDYVYSHHCPSPGSIYQQIRKLDGAEMLVFQRGGLRIERYWQPAFNESASNMDALAEQLRSRLFGAVGDMSGGSQPVGAFLSGGLDSSTVAGALAKARPDSAEAFSMGFPVAGYDEMAYARIAAQHFQARLHEHYLTPDEAVAAIPGIAAAYDEPFGNSSALPAYFCARMAKEHGIGLLLAGDGGDELFAGNQRYATQLLFEGYQAVPGVLRAALEKGLHHLPDPLAERFPLRKVARYVEQANVPLPDRLHDYNYLHRLKLGEVFAPDFLATVNPEAPLEAQRESYQRPKDATSLNRMLYLDWKITLHDNDLVKVNKMCDLAGIEVAYPMLDDGVVELSCAVPSKLKLKPGKLRWFYKEALRDVLPKEVLNKSKHGFGLPFGIWLKEHRPLQELAYDNVLALRNRPYFQPEFLDEAIRLHRSGHSAYYGELIWILMMLELWFAAKEARAAERG